MALAVDAVTALAVLAVALYTLVSTAEIAVDAWLALAKRFDVPDVVIGLTVLAFGTSLPELASHVVASLGILSGTLGYEVTSAVVLGGNVGSSTVQQTLLVGLLLLGYGPLVVTDSFLRSTYLPMVGALVALFVVAFDGTLTRLDGLVLLALYVVYAWYSFATRSRETPVPADSPGSIRREAVRAVGSLLLVLASATLLFLVVETVVAGLALGGSMVGVVTLGLAAALPELSTVLEAIRRRTPNLALGVLIGSNVVNSLVGVGVGASISTYAVPPAFVAWDLPFKIVIAVGLLAYVRFGPDRQLTRRVAGWLVVSYLVYVFGRMLLFGV